jgi:class 3 adenylate cyclase/tetratricopeptide (TPR) repeat protein
VTVCARCGQDNPGIARFCLACGAPLEGGPVGRDVRKTVTVVFTDVTGSTSLGERLDPESMRHVMSRYFDEMKAALERHGGSVEKFIGDAVMAVFGIPTVHEDDALRAVRAAAEMRDALASLNDELERDRGVTLQARTGVNTGEVVAGDQAAGQRLVTGDAVNVAARVEQAAAPGEFLMGDPTWRLVRNAVSVEVVEPLVLKGKAEPLPAHRLVEVTAGEEGTARRFESPMVGRQRPLSLLRQTFDTAVADRAAHLYTVLGAAGVGKSRLVHEFVSGLPPEAQVFRGRCLPYGDGITYWPIHEVFAGAAGIVPEDPPEAARERLRTQAWDQDVTSRIEQVLGLSTPTAPAEEIAWAVRRTLEMLASTRPVVVVLDDIHWAEPTLLDLIEHVVDLSRDAPILLVCIARPELLDDRPGWGGGKLNAVSALLQPLSEDESRDLIENLLGQASLDPSARGRIAEAAGGNPLFVEQILSMLIDDGLLARTNSHWTPTGDLSRLEVPPSIQALLAARLDRLGGEERHVIECASVVGKVFYRGAVVELSAEPIRSGVPAHLTTLVRKELIRPDRSEIGQEDAYRFIHILIRDAAYDAMPKATRAALHEAMADWLTRRAGDRAAEYEEIVAYHLEQAHRYRAELGPLDEHGLLLGERAAALLAAGGRRAMARRDLPASLGLLERALPLMLSTDPHRTELLVDLGLAASEAGAYARAEAVLAEAIDRSETAQDDRVRAHAVMALLNLRVVTDPAVDLDEVQRQAEQALGFLKAAEDDLGMARAWNVLAWTNNIRLKTAARQECLERAIVHARRAGARREELEGLLYLASPVIHGPMPVDEGLRRLEEILERSGGDRTVESSVSLSLAYLHARLGHFDQARQAATRAVAILEELGHRPQAEASRGEGIGYVEVMAGDLVAAERAVRRACEALQAMGETGIFSTQAADLAIILCEQGRFDEAEEFIEVSRTATAADDVLSQVRWRVAQARVLASRGRAQEAVDLVREAVALIEPTDAISVQANTHEELARALEHAGNRAEAGNALRRALSLYEQKGNLVSAERVRRMLADSIPRQPEKGDAGT